MRSFSSLCTSVNFLISTSEAGILSSDSKVFSKNLFSASKALIASCCSSILLYCSSWISSGSCSMTGTGLGAVRFGGEISSDFFPSITSLTSSAGALCGFLQQELQHPLRLLENSYTPKVQPDKVFRIHDQSATFQT